MRPIIRALNTPSDTDLAPPSVAGLSEAAFLARHPEPVVALTLAEEQEKTAEFMTLSGAPLPPTGRVNAEGQRDGAGLVRLVTVCKRGANPFAHMITIGRARNNDICVSTNEVSKFHAYLSKRPDGVWQITDAGSTNGTFYQGRRITARLAHELPNGDSVLLGSTKLTLLYGPKLYAFLKSQGH